MEKDRIIRAFFPDALGIQYRIYAFFFSVFSTHDAHPYGFKTIAHDSWVCIGARSCPVVFEKSKSNWSSGSRLNDLFRKEMQQRGASIVKARKASSAMSTARAVVDHIHDLHFGTRQGDLEINVDHGKFKLKLRYLSYPRVKSKMAFQLIQIFLRSSNASELRRVCFDGCLVWSRGILHYGLLDLFRACGLRRGWQVSCLQRTARLADRLWLTPTKVDFVRPMISQVSWNKHACA